MTNVLEWINRFVWGAPALVLILGVGLYLSIRAKLPQLRFFPKACVDFFKKLRGKNSSVETVSPFQALCTALAATVGTGNLAGVAGAIAIGRYFTEHSRAAYSLMGADDLVKQSQYTLDAIVKNGLLEFTRRDIMRICRSFKTADAVQPVLNHLADLGYVVLKETEQTFGKGRPANPTYLVNPLLYRQAA